MWACLLSFSIKPFYRIGGPASRYVERNSRIPLPRSSSQTAVPHKPDPHSGFKRSKSTLGAPFTPQEKMGGSVKITPQAVSFTPKLYGSYSSKKKGHPKDLRNLQDKEFQKEAAYTVRLHSKHKPLAEFFSFLRCWIIFKALQQSR